MFEPPARSPSCRKTVTASTYVGDKVRGRIIRQRPIQRVPQMKMWFYKFVFFLYKMLVRPFKRTPMRWSAILFNKSGRFAVKHDDQGSAGDLRPGYPIPELCRRGLGLFTSTAPLRLIGIVGRGGEEFTFYYSGEVTSKFVLNNDVLCNLSYVERSELSSFIPPEIERNL